MATITHTQVSIAAGATGLSTVADIRGFRLRGLILPETWVAADITFQAAGMRANEKSDDLHADYGTFYDVFTEAAVEMKVASAGLPTSGGRYVYLNGVTVGNGAGLSFMFLKLRSGVTATPVDQTAARTITLILEREA